MAESRDTARIHKRERLLLRLYSNSGYCRTQAYCVRYNIPMPLAPDPYVVNQSRRTWERLMMVWRRAMLELQITSLLTADFYLSDNGSDQSSESSFFGGDPPVPLCTDAHMLGVCVLSYIYVGAEHRIYILRDIPVDATIATVKTHTSDLSGTPVHLFDLVYEGQVLHDDRTLQEVGVTDLDSRLSVIWKTAAFL